MDSDRSVFGVTSHDLSDFAVCLGFEEDEAIVSVSGDVDVLTAPTLAAVLSAVADVGHVRVVLDLSRVRFLGGAGVGLVSVARAQLDSFGGTLTIRSASRAAQRLFALRGIGMPAGVAFVTGRHSTLGAEQQAGDSTAILVSPEVSLSDLLRSVAIPASTKAIDAALKLVTELATATVEGADGVSVTLDRKGHMVTAASSNDKVFRMDQHQYRTGEGPCLAAAAQGHWFHVESLAEEERWPHFVPLALDEGIGSVLSTPLLVADRPLGALNMYSTTARAFGLEQQNLAALFATQAATILTDAGADLDNADLAGRISEALRSREVIAQAQGVLMARTHVRAADAAALLHRSARTAEVSVLVQATEVVASTRDNDTRG